SRCHPTSRNSTEEVQEANVRTAIPTKKEEMIPSEAEMKPKGPTKKRNR
ncbi:494_t:CDS:1, partial [Rhizophagus irregularis]